MKSKRPTKGNRRPSAKRRDKRAADALRESVERFAQSAQQSRTITWEVDACGLYTFVSPVSERVIGFRPDEIVGKLHFYDLHPETGREAFKAAAFDTFRRKDTFKALENPILTKDGKMIWVVTSGIPLLNTDGTLAGYRGNDTDITERKRAEEALHISQRMLQTVLDTIPVAVFWKDRNLRYLGGNRTWLNAVGLNSPEQVVGKTDFDLPWEKEQASSFREDDKRVMETDAAKYNIIEPFLRADGTRAWAKTNKVPLHDASGNVMGVLGTYEDITESRRMEDELHKAQKLESLGLLAGGIAHDFNNLMGGIFGYIDLALATSQDGRVSGYLSSAIGGIDRARSLTGQLLTFSKGGAPVLETGDLASAIRNSCKFALSGSNVSCVIDIGENLWPCDFDGNQIGQVIDNIIINAQQAMPMGGSVVVSAKNVQAKAGEIGTLPAGSYVKVSILDSGIGIPQEILPRIFDPFFTTKQKGSGLGLSICHSIIMRHNGWIDVESAQGKGATFHIYLPASAVTPAAPPVPKHAPMHRGDGRILIMDDEELIRLSASKLAEVLGYSAVSTRNGKETVALLQEELKAGRSFAAVLLDLTIPGGMGGKEVVAEIRKINAEIPLFVLSGYSTDPVMTDPDKYGFTGSLCKPFTIGEMSELFNRHLKAKS